MTIETTVQTGAGLFLIEQKKNNGIIDFFTFSNASKNYFRKL